jgi:hypothetical protein
MNRKRYLILGTVAVAVLLVLVFVFSDFPPAGDAVSGTMGAVARYVKSRAIVCPSLTSSFACAEVEPRTSFCIFLLASIFLQRRRRKAN